MGLARAWARGLHVPLQPISLPNHTFDASSLPRSRVEGKNGARQPMELFICDHDVSSAQKKYLLREMHQDGGPALLFCAKMTALPSRILLIDQGGRSSDALLWITVNLCEIFRAGLVVLTVARTEREAREHQRRAREILDGGLPSHPAPQGRSGRKGPVQVNFDYLAGAEVRSAAASVARWRRCQLVVLEANAAWERWLSFRSGSWITELLDCLSFLVIPTDLSDLLSPPFHVDAFFDTRMLPRTQNDEPADNMARASAKTAPVPQMLPRQPSLTSPQERGEHLVGGGPADPHLPSVAGHRPRSMRNP
jgi:hypothetical protein